MEMDEASLRAVCKQHRHFATPHLNDTLYCNFKGFTSLAYLEPYTGLRALFLEGNALESTAGLPPLPRLRCLFLQQNMLRELAPGSLAAQPDLHTLNLGSNQLAELEGLEGCTMLHTLVAANNRLAAAAALEPLAAGCLALESLDLQNNLLKDGEAVLAVLSRLPALKCLYLKGNPMVSLTPSYRKATIAAIPTLTFLDDRPVFELERVCTEAWVKGGLEAEREARAAFLEREREREKQQVAALRDIREEGWKKQWEVRGLSGSGDPYLHDLPEDWEAEEEPEELREARQRLAEFTAGRLQQEEQLPEADVQAILEESRASQAALQSRGCLLPSSTGASPQSGKVGNSCPNSSSAGGMDPTSSVPPTAAAALAPLVEVPQAKVTVTVCSSCTGGQEAAAGTQGEGQATVATPGGMAISTAAGQLAGAARWEAEGVEPATDSDDEELASVGEEDCLDALD